MGRHELRVVSAEADVRYLLRWVREQPASVFPEQTIEQGTKGRFRTVGPLRTALAALVDRGHLRVVPTERRYSRRPAYQVISAIRAVEDPR